MLQIETAPPTGAFALQPNKAAKTPSSRLPPALRKIFLEANRGVEVHEPPKDHSACKTFADKSPVEGLAYLKGSLNTASPPTSLLGLLSAAERISAANINGSKDKENVPRNINSSKENAASSTPAAQPKPKIVKNPSYPSRRSPQVFLDVIMRTMGYSTEKFGSLDTSYFNQPTELMTASYDARLQQLIRKEDAVEIREFMECGISKNPCDRFGVGLLHTACRNGYYISLKTMISCGASVKVVDESGKTPLHSAFFGSVPSYEIVDLLIRKDRHLLQLRDKHGATPLSYVPREQWGMWIDFFYAQRDVYFPRRNKRVDGVALCSRRMREEPNTKPLEDPPNALTPEVAAMVAAGKLSPQEARCLADDDDGSAYTSCESSVGDSSLGESWIGDDDDDLDSIFEIVDAINNKNRISVINEADEEEEEETEQSEL